jgi:DNA-binding SARP family transcriptional activator
MHIGLKLLGSFEVSVDGHVIEAAAWKLRHPRQLLQMLALHPHRRIEREQVLAALWPDASPSAAANRMHHTLHLLRTLFTAAGVCKSEPVVVLDPTTISLAQAHTFALDVCSFRQCIAQARTGTEAQRRAASLEQALALYGGELLEGEPHEEWLSACREECRQDRVWALERLAELKRQVHDDEAALVLYQRVIEAEPANELAHRALMQLFDAAQHPERAVHQFELCQRNLARDLDVAPSPATQRLLEDILNRTKCRPVAQDSVVAPRATYRAAPHALPLIGREADVAALQACIERADVRLITIAGRAGAGKTRLAQALVERCQDSFADGAAAVSLTACNHVDHVAEQVARALGIEVAGGDLARQVADHLAPRRMLMLLDRVEHLLPVWSLLCRWLHAAPRLVLLLTSQVPLRCEAEQVYELCSLTERGDDAAVELFCRAAANLGVAIDCGRDRQTLASICRRVDGNALSVQLAAGQTQMLSLQELDSQLARPLDVLATPLRDGERVHTSLRQAIAWTLGLLPRETQDVFTLLGVFAHRFTLDDARQVLAPFIAPDEVERHLKTLLQWHLLGRFECLAHAVPTVRFGFLDAPRQFARDLAVADARWGALVDSLGRHLAGRCKPLFDERNSNRNEAVRRLEPLLADVRQLMLDGDFEPLAKSLRCDIALYAGTLRTLCGAVNESRAWYADAAGRCAAADADNLAWVYAAWTSALAYCNEFDAAARAARQGLAVAAVQKHGAQPMRQLLRMWALMRGEKGQFDAALRHIRALTARCEAADSAADLTMEHYVTAQLLHLRGELALAGESVERCHEAALRAGNRSMQLAARNLESLIQLARGKVGAARATLDEVVAAHGHAAPEPFDFDLAVTETVIEWESSRPEQARAAVDRLLVLAQATGKDARSVTRYQALAMLLSDALSVELGQWSQVHHADCPEVDALRLQAWNGHEFVRGQCARMRYFAHQGRRQKEQACLAMLLEAVGKQRSDDWRIWVDLARCQIALERQEYRQAEALLEAALSRVMRSPDALTPRLQRTADSAAAALAEALEPAHWGTH